MRTEQEKQRELLGILGQSLAAGRIPSLQMILEQTPPDSEFTDYPGEEMDAAIERDDDREATENLPGH